MTKQNQSGGGKQEQTQTTPVAGEGVEGEGSYTGTRRYNEHLKQHIETHNTEELAEQARKALEGDEKAELEDAERRAKRGPMVRPEPGKS
jgi:hypothetical protein